MKCIKCGEEIKDGDHFCIFCGARQDGQPTEKENAQSAAAPQPAAAANHLKPAAGKGKLILYLIPAVVIVLGVVLFNVFRKPVIDLNSYGEVTFEGANHYGRAEYIYNYEQLFKDIADKMKINKKKLNAFSQDALFDDMQERLSYNGSGSFGSMTGNSGEEIVEYFMGKLFTYYLYPDFEYTDIKEGELSNGDKVTLKWTLYDNGQKLKEDIEDLLGIKIKYADKTYTANGLAEVGSIDAFKDVTLHCSGIAPYGQAYAECKSEEQVFRTIHFDLDKSSGLSNGDVVTVTIGGDRAEVSGRFAQEIGKVPMEFSKQFTVEGLDSYIQTVADIPEDVLNKCKAQTEDLIKARTSSWDEESAIKEMNYIGGFLLSPKTEYDDNEFICIYKVIASYTKGNLYEEVPFYYPVRFSSILKKGDGTVEFDVMNYSDRVDDFHHIVGEGTDDQLQLRYYGYQTLSEIEKEMVTPKLGDYSADKAISE